MDSAKKASELTEQYKDLKNQLENTVNSLFDTAINENPKKADILKQSLIELRAGKLTVDEFKKRLEDG